MRSNIKNTLLFLLIFCIGFFVGGYYFRESNFLRPEGVNFTPFYEAWEKIEERFYDYSEDVHQDMIYGAIQGLIDGLKDPYSDFLNPDETKEFEENLSGSYEGIGAEIGIRNEILTIVSPLKNSPAEKAGLLPGDKILTIDETSTEDLELLEAVMMIRGKAGTKIKLRINRGNKTWVTEIKRARIDIPTIDFEIIDNNIGYVQIYNFYEDAPSKFRKITKTILENEVEKMIIDLRNNPGGYLSAAVDIGNFFIKEGEIIVKEDFGGGETRDVTSEGPGTFSGFRVVVLINSGSASASEILAGTLKEQNNNTIIVGEKSFGKGTVQEFIYLLDRSGMKLTVAHWLLPSGESIEGNGIVPDVKVKMSEDDIKSGRDPQLKKAIQEASK